MKHLSELEEMCKSRITQMGIDGRTSYFAGIVRSPESVTHKLQDLTGIETPQIQRILKGFVSERYADYLERTTNGFHADYLPITFILSQGYKRGLVWRGIPLGKTCWDISIYQQLLQELKPQTLIEFGTGLGGSTLFFLDHCRLFGLSTKVITMDVNHRDVNLQVLGEKSIRFIHGDVKKIAATLPAQELATFPHPWLIVEDCHQEVPLIVRHLHPHMVSGDYLIIEDIATSEKGSFEILQAIQSLPPGSLMVDTFYTDMFGHNITCAPDSIFRKM
jgi:cephalosporin hydroxylase